MDYLRTTSHDTARLTQPSRGRISSPRGDQLSEFVVKTVLNQRHPAYHETRLAASPRHPDAPILLPALELPVFPGAYRDEFFHPITAEFAVCPKEIAKKSSGNDRTACIDGVPYDPQDFQFPTSAKEKEKLAALAALLGATPLPVLFHQKRSSCVADMKRPTRKLMLRPQPGKYTNERMELIKRDTEYREELQAAINHKLSSPPGHARNEGRSLHRRGRTLASPGEKELSMRNEAICRSKSARYDTEEEGGCKIRGRADRKGLERYVDPQSVASCHVSCVCVTKNRLVSETKQFEGMKKKMMLLSRHGHDSARATLPQMLTLTAEKRQGLRKVCLSPSGYISERSLRAA